MILFFLKKRFNNKGFSLIELMVVLVLLSIIILGLVTFFSGGVRSWVSGQSQLEAQRNARQAMDYMVRELRHSDKLIGLGGVSDIHGIKVSIPGLNGAGSQYNVHYFWSGTAHDPVERHMTGSGEGQNILIDDVLKLEFTYPKSSRVNILLEIDVDHDYAADISLTSVVNFRNFKK